MTQENSEKENSAEVNLDEARKVGSTGQIIAAPSQTGLCAALNIANGQAAAMACSDRLDLKGVTVTDQGQTAWGVVPDGVTAVTASFKDGKKVDIPVINNGFMQSFGIAPASLESAS